MSTRRRGALWPWLLGGLLAANVVFDVGFFWVAATNPSFAVEKDYYEKAQHWDEKRAQDARNLALGWTVDVVTTPVLGAPGKVEVAISVGDRDGQPVSGADVALTTFHNARAASPLEATLAETDEAGVYSAVLPMRRPGLWELRLTLTRADDLFTAVETKTVETGLKLAGRS